MVLSLIDMDPKIQKIGILRHRNRITKSLKMTPKSTKGIENEMVNIYSSIFLLIFIECP